MEKQIKHFRRIAFTLLAMAKGIVLSDEMALAYRSLQMGRGWLGQALKPYGPSPYVPAERPENIPPTADTGPVSAHLLQDPGVFGFDFESKEWVFSEDLTLLKKVNHAREEIQKMVDSLEANVPQPEGQRKCFENAIKHFQEAKMWYGYQLELMRNAVPDNATQVPLPKEPIIDEPPAAPTKEEVEEADKLFDSPELKDGDLVPDRPIKKSRKKSK